MVPLPSGETTIGPPRMKASWATPSDELSDARTSCRARRQWRRWNPPIRLGFRAGTVVADVSGQGDTKMKTIAKLFIGFSLIAASAAASADAPRRGAVTVAGPSVKAVVAGPTSIRAYAAFAGGVIYTAPAVSGTDSDCRARSATTTALPADKMVELTVGAGQVACLETVRAGSF